MIFTDLRHYISTLEKLGQLKVIEGASCDLEIGAITEMATSAAQFPGGAVRFNPRVQERLSNSDQLSCP